jgi:hypothetical protein
MWLGLFGSTNPALAPSELRWRISQPKQIQCYKVRSRVALVKQGY